MVNYHRAVICLPCASCQNIASQFLFFMMFTSFIDYNAPGKVLSPVRVYIFPVHSDLFILCFLGNHVTDTGYILCLVMILQKSNLNKFGFKTL